MTEPIALLTCGPSDHGIVRFGRDLVGAARRAGFSGHDLHAPDPTRLDEVADQLPAAVRLVHLQINDWLLTDGRRPPEDRLASFARRLRARGTDLSLTLHDLPQPGPASELSRRRAVSYSRMAAEAISLVVSSDHERACLEASWEYSGESAATAPVRVIRLPLPTFSLSPDRPAGRVRLPPATVGVLGFVYPGKGHREVLDELAGGSIPVTVVAIGQPSNGHQHMVDELRTHARRLGLEFLCTGYVPDQELFEYVRSVAVPVAPAANVSASASINSWIGGGRRPLVADGRYSRELDRAYPGSIRRYRPGELRDAVAAALARSSRTRRMDGVSGGPSPSEVAAQYLRWLRDLRWLRSFSGGSGADDGDRPAGSPESGLPAPGVGH